MIQRNMIRQCLAYPNISCDGASVLDANEVPELGDSVRQRRSNVEHGKIVKPAVVGDEVDHVNAEIEEHKPDEHEFEQNDSYEDSLLELEYLADVEAQYDLHPDLEYYLHVKGMLKKAKSKTKRNHLSEALKDCRGEKKLTKPKLKRGVVFQPMKLDDQQERTQDADLTDVYASIQDSDGIQGVVTVEVVIPPEKLDVTAVISLKTSPNRLSMDPWQAYMQNPSAFTAEQCYLVGRSIVDVTVSSIIEQGMPKVIFWRAGVLTQDQNDINLDALQGLLPWVNDHKCIEAEMHYRHADQHVRNDLLLYLSRVVTYPSASSCDKPPPDPGKVDHVYNKLKLEADWEKRVNRAAICHYELHLVYIAAFLGSAALRVKLGSNQKFVELGMSWFSMWMFKQYKFWIRSKMKELQLYSNGITMSFATMVKICGCWSCIWECPQAEFDIWFFWLEFERPPEVFKVFNCVFVGLMTFRLCGAAVYNMNYRIAAACWDSQQQDWALSCVNGIKRSCECIADVWFDQCRPPEGYCAFKRSFMSKQDAIFMDLLHDRVSVSLARFCCN